MRADMALCDKFCEKASPKSTVNVANKRNFFISGVVFYRYLIVCQLFEVLL